MKKFKFKGQPDSGEAKTSAGPPRKFKFKGQASAKKKNEIAKQRMIDLTDCLFAIHGDWKTFEQAKEEVLACFDTVFNESKGHKKVRTQIARARLNVSRMSSLKEIISYCYQLRLKIDGMSLSKVLRSK